MGKYRAPIAARCAALMVLASVASGCTTLGPTPAMTGIAAPPLERPGVELQAGFVPGYYLSSAVQDNPKGAALTQVAAVFEPDSLIRVPGVLVGARYAGSSSAGAAIEPLLGYRSFLDDEKRFSLAALGFLAYADAARRGASFAAWRGGGEAGLDVRLTPRSHYAEIHTNLGATLTVLDANGAYCLDSDERFGVDCPDEGDPRRAASARVSGVFPSAHAGGALDFGRHLASPFHGVRLALDFALGAMPTVQNAEERSAELYGSAGLTLTLGLGAKRGTASEP